MGTRYAKALHIWPPPRTRVIMFERQECHGMTDVLTISEATVIIIIITSPWCCHLLYTGIMHDHKRVKNDPLFRFFFILFFSTQQDPLCIKQVHNGISMQLCFGLTEYLHIHETYPAFASLSAYSFHMFLNIVTIL